MSERASAYGETGVVDVERFSRLLRGRVVAPSRDGQGAYHWTGREWVRSRPRLIVQCRGPFDVIEAVRYANARDIRIAVWAGGEARSRFAPADDAMVLDLSRMKRVTVDARAGKIVADAGLSGEAFDEQTRRSGMAAPVGMEAGLSMAEATLDAEPGWLSRRGGLACDSLCAANLVTPQGDYVQVDEQHEPDLFWAIRGGGANFGVVTSFTYRAHQADPEVFGGSIVYPLGALGRVVDFYFEVAEQCGDEITLRLVLAEVSGRSACTLQVLSHQGREDSAVLAASLRRLAAPLADTLGVMPYPSFRQAIAMPGAEPGRWTHASRAIHLAADMLTPACKTTLWEWLERWPAEQCMITLEHLGGEIGRVQAAATAFPYRDARHRLLIGVLSREPEDTVAVMRYEFGLLSALGADPLRFAFDEPPGCRAHAWHAYAGNYNRLAHIKRIGDPDGRFVGNGLFDHLYR